MVLDLVPGSSPVLRTPSRTFDFQNPEIDPVKLATDLTDTMLKNGGVGLAAPQVGIDLRVFTLRTNPIIVCFNPKIVDASEEEVVMPEGCLSFPNLVVKVKRSKFVRVRFQFPNGEFETHQFDGITSRAFQHELDHIDGVLYYNRASRYHRDAAVRRWERLMKYQERSK